MSDDNERVIDHRLPGTFHDPYTGSTMGRSVPVLSMTEAEIKRYSEHHSVCGECHHFISLEDHHCAALLAQGRFLVKLVDEYEWKLEHAFPNGVEHGGFCDAHGYLTQAFAVSKACAYTPRRGKVRRKASDNELLSISKDRKVADKKAADRFREFRRSLNRPDER